ncbi:MAG: ACT domain-containing protein [Pseudomonadota bacterium]
MSSTSVQLVMTVIGRDRPGLVERLSRQVEEHGGNWLESRMAHLASYFAGVLRVEVPEDRLAALRERLEGMSAEGLQMTLQQASDVPVQARRRRALLEVTGYDRPGIVRAVTSALAARGVNIDELETELAGAPMSGTPTFHARAILHLPEDLTVRALSEALEIIGSDLMVDIELDESEA